MTEPKTCFDTSNAHIFNGRCGRSRHRLYTNDSRAKAPRAAWTIIENGPSSWHSPLSSGGSSSRDALANAIRDIVGEALSRPAKAVVVDQRERRREAKVNGSGLQRSWTDFSCYGEFHGRHGGPPLTTRHKSHAESELQCVVHTQGHCNSIGVSLMSL